MAENTEEKKSKKKTLTRIGLIALILLLFGGGVAALLLSKKKAPEPEEVVTDDDTTIYWNVDREKFAGRAATGLTSRKADKDDGYFHMLFASGGRQFNRRVENYKLANLIDQEEVLGLVVNDKGIVVGMKKIEEFTGGYDVYGYYVLENKGDGKFLLNTSETLNGLDVEWELPSTAKIYDVSSTATQIGVELKVTDVTKRDRIIAIKDKDGVVSTVFVVNRKIQYPVYWNKTRMYNSELKTTTRKPNEDGEYVFEMAMGGGPVIVKTKSLEVASQMDGMVANLMGLVFDENGYVSGVKSGKATCGGNEVSSWYHVIEVSDTEFISEKQSEPYKGTTYHGILSDDFKAYDVSGLAEVYGEARPLRLGDQIHAVCNYDGEVCVAFIVSALHTHVCPHCGKEVDFKLWDYVVGSITESGHYYIRQDLPMKSQLNIGTLQIGNVNVVLDLNGHTITGNNGQRAIVVMGDNSTLALVDCSEDHSALINANGDITTTMNTTVSAPLWVRSGSLTNYGVRIDFSESRSSRMTKDGSTATNSGIIVSKGAKLTLIGVSVTGDHARRGAGIYAEGDVILNSSVITGGVAEEEGGGIYLASSGSLKLMGSSAVNNNRNAKGASSNVYVSKGALIYVDNSFANTPGRVKVTGRYKGAFTDKNGAAKQAAFASDSPEIVIAPTGDGSMSFTHIGAMDHPHVLGTKAQIDAKEGTEVVFERWTSENSLPESDGYYYLANDVTLSGGYTPAEGSDIHLCFNGHTVTGAGGGNRVMTGLISYNSTTKVMTCANNVHLSYCDCKNGGGITTIDNKNAAGNQGSLFWLCGENETLSIYGGTFTVGKNYSSTAASGALICLGGKNNTFNLYGGTLKGGVVSQFGANLSVGVSDTFNMYGGTIEGGTAARGGNVHAAGTLNLMGGTIENGVATAAGGNILADSGAVVNVKGTKILGGQVTGSSGGGWYYGGNVAMNPGSAFTMESGTIENGASAGVGGNVYINGTAEITGGTVKNGTASGSSKDVYLDGLASVTHKGGDIGTVYFNKTSRMIVGGGKANLILTSAATEDTLTADPAGIAKDAAYSIQFINPGILVKNGADAIDNFTIPEGAYTLQAEEGHLIAAPPKHTHCFCGGTAATGHTCADKDWIPWNETTRLPGTGLAAGEYYYYLTQNLTGVAATNPPAGVTVHLCLNGYTVTGKTNDRIFQNNGSSNSLYTITDCSEKKTGLIKGKATFGGQGNMFWSAAGSCTLEFYGITIDGTEVSGAKNGSGAGYGGVVAADGGTVKMFGCTVNGGKQAGAGGQICLCNSSKFIAENTVFDGGETTTSIGGCLYGESSSSFELVNCTVKNGKATKETQGKEIYLAGSASLLMRGGDLGNVYVSGANAKAVVGGGKATITLNGSAKEGTLSALTDGFVTGSICKVVYVNPGIIVKNGAPYLSSFDIDGGTYEVRAEGNDIVVAAPKHVHCFCGDTEVSEHTCSKVEWKPWSDSTRLPGTGLAAGEYYYYLTQDLSGVGNTNPPKNVKVHLCLNGFTVTGKTGDRIYQNNGSDASLYTICDCSEKKTGKIVGKATFGNQGGMFWSGTTTCALEFYGITIDATDVSCKKNTSSGVGYGGVIAIDGGTVKMYGCTVKGGKHEGAGGQICLCNSSKFIAENSTFEGGVTTGSHGGNFYAESTSSITLTDCIVKGGSTTGTGKMGGNIYVCSNATLTMKGGSIEDGTAAEGGGNLWVESAKPVNLTDVEMKGGTARYGGNVGMDKSTATVNFTECTVTKGIANFSYGGNIYFNNGTMVFTKCTVTDGQCTGAHPSGPNLYKGTNAKVTYNDTTITN